jgi:Predicted solute binding protein
MGNIRRIWALILIAVIALSCLTLLTVKPANSQTTTKPSAPEFTLRYVDNSYDVPPTATSTTDPYTGKTVTTTTPGYHVENKSVEITVTNQPFSVYSDAEGNNISLSYNVRFKGHFGAESDWKEPFYQPIRNGIYGFTEQHPQSNFAYTIIAVPSEFKIGDVVDFQVQTLEGYYTPWEPLPVVMGTSQFSGQSSEWSNTQTLTIGEATNSNTPTPTSTAANPTPITPTFTATPAPTSTASEINSNSTDSISLPLSTFAAIIAVIVLLVVALSVLALRSYRKTTKSS